MKIKSILLELGITPNLKGFKCICEAVSYIIENDNAKIKDVYEYVAKNLGYAIPNVERAIRHCISKANKTSETWDKYIGCKKVTNSTFLFILALKLEDKYNG